MKRAILITILLLAVLAFLPADVYAAEATGEPAKETETAEWTVMFYLCGSDLESKYGYASGNLKEIQGVYYPDSYTSIYKFMESDEFEPETAARPAQVNVLIETGGSSRWHTEGLWMDTDISTDCLQRWRYHCSSILDDLAGESTGFELLENCPLASMSDPDTLTDFIRWSVQAYPAKKYALVLWDHGGGALTGLLIDELFDGDVMYLTELKQALADSGVQLEALVIDACLMANIETAWAVKDSARWLVASEETVPGQGTAIRDWLQELYFHPECDGRQLGRTICDMTQIKYARKEDERAQAILTWSVIDLSKTDNLVYAMDQFFRELGENLNRYPSLSVQCAYLFLQAEEYGDGRQKMRDIASVFYHSETGRTMDIDIRNRIVEALSDTVVYSVHGSGRSAARGLSFCYPSNEDSATLDIYAQTCPSPWYLAYLDAISDWTAPDSVYETAVRLPQIDTIEELQLTATKCMTETGFPAIRIDNLSQSLSGYYYRLYYLEPNTEQTVFMGRTNCRYTYLVNENQLMLYAYEPWMWPTINDTPCSMDMLIEKYAEGGEIVLYGIPVQVGSVVRFLRCGRTDPYDPGKKRTYEVYGVWDEYNQNSQMADRSVISLAELAGQEYRLLWPLDRSGSSNADNYVPAGQTRRLFRALGMEEAPLPAGTYYLEYEMDDIFMHPYVLERIEFTWDGEKVSFPDGFTWQGEFILQWIGKDQ